MLTFCNGHFSILKKNIFFLIRYPLIGISSPVRNPNRLKQFNKSGVVIGARTQKYLMAVVTLKEIR